MTEKIQKPTSIRMPRDLEEDMKLLAEAHQRSVNKEIIWALQQYREQNRREIEEVKAKSSKTPRVS